MRELTQRQQTIRGAGIFLGVLTVCVGMASIIVHFLTI